MEEQALELMSIYSLGGVGKTQLALLIPPQHGSTHAFVVEFGSAEDRDFYVKSDESHLAFVKRIRVVVADAQVIDFSPGKY